MRYFRNGLEIVMAALAVTIISMFLAYAWPDKDYGLSGWIQAVGSILAILAAGHIASTQARRQFEDARQLQRIEDARVAYRMAKATSVIAGRVGVVLLRLIRLFDSDRETFCKVAEDKRGLCDRLLAEMQADLSAIPLHDVPSSRIIDELIFIRSSLDQLVPQIELALNNWRRMDAELFEKFFGILDDAHMKISRYIAEVDSITKGIGREI